MHSDVLIRCLMQPSLSDNVQTLPSLSRVVIPGGAHRMTRWDNRGMPTVFDGTGDANCGAAPLTAKAEHRDCPG